MPVRAGERWRAGVLSLAWPGVGQAYAGSATAPLWALVALGIVAAPLHPEAAATLWLLLGVLAARHAVRLDGGRTPRDAVTLRLDGGRVDLRTTLDLARPAAHVWAFVSDVERFAQADPFHDRVRRSGRDPLLEHCVLGFRFERVGRILWWREGRGYAFSDLSARGPRAGFPHVFFVDIEPCGARACRLSVRVRGRWTATKLPRFLVRAWLRVVAREHGRLLHAAVAGGASLHYS